MLSGNTRKRRPRATVGVRRFSTIHIYIEPLGKKFLSDGIPADGYRPMARIKVHLYYGSERYNQSNNRNPREIVMRRHPLDPLGGIAVDNDSIAPRNWIQPREEKLGGPNHKPPFRPLGSCTRKSNEVNEYA